MRPIVLSAVFVVDPLGSVGLVGLCAAVFDPIIFKLVLAATIFCVIGFLITTICSVAESIVYRHYEGSKWLWDVLSARWKRTMELLPFRVAIETVHGILALAISAWRGIMGRLDESVTRFFHHSGRRGTLIPMVVTSRWSIVRASVLMSSTVDSGGLEAVHDDDKKRLDDVHVLQVEDKVKSAARFWQQPDNADGVPLHAIKTHVHEDAIR